MADKTSDAQTLYSWAINAVRKEMEEEHGFSVHLEDVSLLSFEKDQVFYGIMLPKQGDLNNLMADRPFEIVPLTNRKIHNREAETTIGLAGITADVEEVKDFVKRRIDKLFGK